MSAFQEMKDRLAECATTAYFEVGKDIEVVVDASPSCKSFCSPIGVRHRLAWEQRQHS